MKIAIISDTHFGDSQCSLVTKINDEWRVNESAFKRFCDCLEDEEGEIKDFAYLMILGDVLDLAVSNYDNTLKAAKPFFDRIRNMEYFPEIIFVTGNHDHALWTNLQHQHSVIDKVMAGQPPQRVDWALPGLITNDQGKLNLSGNIYKNTYLDYLTDNRSFFKIASPNIYLKDKEKSMIFTHGQFLDFPWSIEGETANVMFGDDLNIIPLSKMQHILGDNFALNQFICSGTGQGEVNLTNIVQSLEHDAKKGDYSKMVEYILNLLRSESIKDDLIIVFWVLINFCYIHFIVSSKGKNRFSDFQEALHISLEAERGNKGINGESIDRIKEFTKHIETHIDKAIPSQSERIKDYYIACVEDWNNHFKSGIKIIDYMIFGHTHKAVPWSQDKINWNDPDKSVVPNTGSWLVRDSEGKKVFAGANVFIYDSQSLEITFKSVPAGEILND